MAVKQGMSDSKSLGEDVRVVLGERKRTNARNVGEWSPTTRAANGRS